MIRIVRTFHTYEGEFGHLYHGDKFLCATAELPWKDNAKDTSCIPEGAYTLKRHVSPTKGETFIVCGDHGRADVLIHKGNIPAKDSKGCILVGLDHGFIGQSKAVLYSGHALDKIMALLEGVDEVPLVIERASTSSTESTPSTKGETWTS